MKAEKRKEINDLAKTLREGLDIRTPVDVYQTVMQLGGEVLEDEQLESGVEALVRKCGEQFEIVLHSESRRYRKRFSVAHEIGHLLLHMGYLISPDDWNKASDYKDSVRYRFGHGIEEEEANEFAAAFLMPEKNSAKSSLVTQVSMWMCSRRWQNIFKPLAKLRSSADAIWESGFMLVDAKTSTARKY
jgi:hypothetical protein